ncbi:hypothetical protein FG386_002288 [Cryptosporidium ryanae]|uniref:uncharacterized protein n=1 Tax=Cryptosporidium ryanae TaxID=515981 RepID=UPI00351A34C7|nr:hypothetical protein FG386_002288 [Cryptosporidium ryanae]
MNLSITCLDSDVSDNPFFRKKPSTKVHHPPGGTSSIGFGIGDHLCESTNKNKETLSASDNHNHNRRPESNGNIRGDLDMRTNDDKTDNNIENREKNIQVNAQREYFGSDSTNFNKSLKTNVKVHNPPGGKSSFSLY